MREATLSDVQGFLKKIAAEQQGTVGVGSGDFLARLNSAWPIIRSIGREEVTGEDIRYLIEELRAKTGRFRPGVLDAVRALDDVIDPRHQNEPYFRKAQITVVRGGQGLADLRRIWAFRFRDLYSHYNGEDDPSFTPTIGSEVIYLERLVRGSEGCTFGHVVAGPPSVDSVLQSLPKVEGLRWTFGNLTTILRIFHNHRWGEGHDLLYDQLTWTIDSVRDKGWPPGQIIVGGKYDDKVTLGQRNPFHFQKELGLFVLGVPV